MTEKKAIAIKPLGGKSLDNAPYVRREEVSAQIFETLLLEFDEMRREILSGNLKSETLVYLFREFFEAGLRDEIYEVLSKNVLRLLTKYRGRVKDFEEFSQNIQLELLKKICNFDTSSGDYAQVSFGEFIIGLAQNEFRKYLVKDKKDSITDSTETEKEDDGKIFELESKGISAEKKLLIREAISQLPENLREACILHYLKGWKIKSNNEFEPTLTKYFQKSDRQIRNWFAEAERILADWKGVLR